MEAAGDAAARLRCQITALENELSDLKRQLAQVERSKAKPTPKPKTNRLAEGNGNVELRLEEYKRYGRQMILPEVGLQGQLRLKNASVLVIGVGGLGCPAAAYLAGAGVGTLGFVDGDTVEISNLHRQILHSSGTVGMLKVDSAIKSLKLLNPNVNYRAHPEHVTSTTILDIIEEYDLLLDCTDHPTTRYLISDAAVIAGKPLISASALRTEGQLEVLNNPPNQGGFCYRCVFPKPSPPESVLSCGEGGILGPVVGIMGVLMAVEAIKVIIAHGDPVTGLPHISEDKKGQGSMLLYSALSDPSFRRIGLRGKRPDCPSCSKSATITRESLISGSLDYVSFCGVTQLPDVHHERVSAKEYAKIKGNHNILVDVREKIQFDICNIEGSINLPFSEIRRNPNRTWYERTGSNPDGMALYIVCRYGNDSQLTANIFKNSGFDSVRDIKGGLRAWKQEVDPDFPEY